MPAAVIAAFLVGHGLIHGAYLAARVAHLRGVSTGVTPNAIGR